MLGRALHLRPLRHRLEQRLALSGELWLAVPLGSGHLHVGLLQHLSTSNTPAPLYFTVLQFTGTWLLTSRPLRWLNVILPCASSLLLNSISQDSTHSWPASLWLATTGLLALKLPSPLPSATTTLPPRTAQHLRSPEQALAQARRLEPLALLAGGVAHDFNNLLTVILGYSGALLERSTEKPRTQDSLGEIKHAADLAGRLTRQLLAHSRRQAPTRAPVELSQMLRQLKRLLLPTLKDGVALTLQVPGAPCWVQADRTQLEQLVLNLVVNASDALHASGRIEIRLSLDDYFALIDIQDNGPGIPPDVVPHIFEPFFTTKPSNQGTGLGLATVANIVEQHGGSVDLHTEPDAGTRFRIHLPLAAPERPSPEPQPPLADEDQPSGTTAILVVEDDASVRAFVVHELQALGYRVHEAPSGDQALAMCQGNGPPIGLLVTDLVMPHMPGCEVARHLQRAHPHLKLLYISGHIDGRAFPEKAAHILHKPFSSADLRSAVAQVLA